MQLLDHVSISVAGLDNARPFYDAVMAALGAVKVYDHADALGYGERCRAGDAGHTYLSVQADAAASPTAPARRHWCFKAASRAAVDAFHAAGLAHGGRDEGAPGLPLLRRLPVGPIRQSHRSCLPRRAVRRGADPANNKGQ
jgi:catechol 2,3-dioxygenase-like lactoylglutathione lyase family enzyme